MCSLHLNLQIWHGGPHAFVLHGPSPLPGTLVQGEGISPKSGTVSVQVWECRRSFQAKTCSVCVYTNHSNAPLRCKSDAQACLGSHIVPSAVPSLCAPGKAVLSHLLPCSCASKCSSPKGWCLHILPASPSPQPQENSSGAAQKSLGIREGICSQ